MDQLRKAWGWLQRQHFWVLIVVAILVALGLSGGAEPAHSTPSTPRTSRARSRPVHARRARVAAKPFHANAEGAGRPRPSKSPMQQKSVERIVEAALRAANRLSAQVAEQSERRVPQAHREAEIRRRHSARICGATTTTTFAITSPSLPKIVGALEAAGRRQRAAWAGWHGPRRWAVAVFNVRKLPRAGTRRHAVARAVKAASAAKCRKSRTSS